MPDATPISAAASVGRPAVRIFEFLSDLDNHWLLGDRFVSLDAVGSGGGRIRIRGPFGISRLARTRIVSARPPAEDAPGCLEGRAELDSGSVARIAWRVERDGADRARVALEAVVERCAGFDRAVLALGGRWWLRRSLAHTVAGLDRVVS
jgi:hypothetical protein